MLGMPRLAALAALAALLALFVWPAAALAQEAGYPARIVSVTSWVEEWDPVELRWVRVSGEQVIAPGASVAQASEPAGTGPASAARFSRPMVRPHAATATATAFAAPVAPGTILATYGPFAVLDRQRAAIIGSTDSASPRAFDAMLRDFPGLRVIELIEAPGTDNDLANLAVGRRIRAAGLATHVPRGGSVRSGAVELFLAGAARSVEEGARFAVHAWLDTYGREPGDFPEDAPENRLYLDYYVEMGMSPERARRFYAMTNSVPHHSARWFGAEEMRSWLRAEATPVSSLDRALMARREIAPRPFAIEASGAAPITLPVLDLPVPLAIIQAPRIPVMPVLHVVQTPALALAGAADAA